MPLRVIFLLAALMGALPVALAKESSRPSLSAIEPIYLGEGSAWELFVRGRTPAGDAPLIIGVTLPLDAVMTEFGDGWYQIYWKPLQSDIGKHLVTLRAMDRHDSNQWFDRDIVIEVQSAADNSRDSDVNQLTGLAAANPVDQPSVTRRRTARSSYLETKSLATVASETATITAGEVPAKTPPVLAPIATHIISAGRAVMIRVEPVLDHDLPPIIQIDRLPSNASFDANEDGSRTFFWPTSDNDQGQHRFRVTVIHPDNASLRSTQDLTVVVGDPSKQFTVPQDQ